MLAHQHSATAPSRQSSRRNNRNSIDRDFLQSIAGLSLKYGFCWASNSHFAVQFGVSERAIQKAIRRKTDSGEMTVTFTQGQRRIQLADDPRVESERSKVRPNREKERQRKRITRFPIEPSKYTTTNSPPEPVVALSAPKWGEPGYRFATRIREILDGPDDTPCEPIVEDFRAKTIDGEFVCYEGVNPDEPEFIEDNKAPEPPQDKPAPPQPPKPQEEPQEAQQGAPVAPEGVDRGPEVVRLVDELTARGIPQQIARELAILPVYDPDTILGAYDAGVANKSIVSPGWLRTAFRQNYRIAPASPAAQRADNRRKIADQHGADVIQRRDIAAIAKRIDDFREQNGQLIAQWEAEHDKTVTSGTDSRIVRASRAGYVNDRIREQLGLLGATPRT